MAANAVAQLGTIVSSAAQSTMAVLVAVPDEFPAEWKLASSPAMRTCGSSCLAITFRT